jgi:hypothetical protein
MRTGKKKVVLSTKGEELTKMDKVKGMLYKMLRFIAMVAVAGQFLWPYLEPHAMPYVT